MNRNELVAAVVESTGLSKRDAAGAVDGVFSAIVDALKSGDDVKLAGFGSFRVVHRPASQGRNPQTGEAIQLSARNLPRFRPGKPLQDALNV